MKPFWKGILLLLALDFWLSPGPLRAATVSWDGGAPGGANGWGHNNNWNPNGDPASGSDLFMTGGAKLTNNIAAGGVTRNYNSITFGPNALGSFLIGGGAVTNGAGGITIDSLNFSQSMTNTSFVLGASQTWAANSNNFSISAAVDLQANTLTLNGPKDVTISGAINGTGALTKSGAGTNTLSGASANTFSGATTINAGMVILQKTAGVDAIAGNVTINTGGTLLLGADNQINITGNMTLAGGEFDTGSFDETLGTLTLTVNSTIDMTTAGGSTINFADSSAVAWTGGATVEITGYDSTDDAIYFGAASSGLAGSQVAQVKFRDPAGRPAGLYDAAILSDGRVVPVPEPATLLAGGVLAGLLAWRERRRRSTGW